LNSGSVKLKCAGQFGARVVGMPESLADQEGVDAVAAHQGNEVEGAQVAVIDILQRGGQPRGGIESSGRIEGRSAKQRRKLGGRDHRNQTLLEITRVASKQIVSLATGSRYCLHGILEISPAQCQCLLKDLRIDWFDLQQSGQIDQHSGSLLLAQVF
jgi:hypothetical protein